MFKFLPKFSLLILPIACLVNVLVGYPTVAQAANVPSVSFAPSSSEDVMDALKSSQTIKKAPDFKSISILKSEDGTRFALSQWEDLAQKKASTLLVAQAVIEAPEVDTPEVKKAVAEEEAAKTEAEKATEAKEEAAKTEAKKAKEAKKAEEKAAKAEAKKLKEAAKAEAKKAKEAKKAEEKAAKAEAKKLKEAAKAEAKKAKATETAKEDTEADS